MNHTKNKLIRELFMHHMRLNLMDPPDKIMSLAEACISFLEAWEAQNPTEGMGEEESAYMGQDMPVIGHYAVKLTQEERDESEKNL